MPTIQQLPQLTNVQPTDEVLVERAGISYGTNVAILLTSTQPALTLAPGSLLGRVSPTSGGPEPVLTGNGLKLQNGLLGIDPSWVASLNSPALTGTPTAPTRPQQDASNAIATTAFVKSLLQSPPVITLAGDIAGSGSSNIVATLPQITTPGSFTKLTVNAKGQVIAGGLLSVQDVAPLLQPATRSTPGVVKIGNGLSLAADGTIDVNDGLKTVHDFGAVGDGQTDDTRAFTAYGVWLRQQLNSNSAQQAWVLGFGRRYIVSGSIDFTNFRYFTFEGHDSQIISNARGVAAIDALGMENCLIRDLSLYSGAPTDPAFIGLQLGVYSDGFGHPQNTIENVTITGFFSRACLFNAGSETTSFVDLKLVNEYVGTSVCYGLIQDGTGFWSIISQYVTVTRTANIGASFNENLFVKPVIETNGGGPAVWMSATRRHAYKSGYMKVGNNLPIAVLHFLDNSGAAHLQSLLDWDVHGEASPSSIFLISGYSAPILAGLQMRDHLVQAKTIFSLDTGVISFTVRNAYISVPEWYSPTGATQRFFDAPAQYTLQGTVAIDSVASAAWQPPSQFVGTFLSDDITPFSFGPGSVIAQSFVKSQLIGPIATTAAFSAGNGAVAIATDPTNANIEVGAVRSSGSPFLDFNGANVGSGYSVRVAMDASSQLTFSGAGGSGATLRLPGGQLQTASLLATGTITAASAGLSGVMIAGGGIVSLGGDATNGNIEIGKVGNGTPYLDFWGVGVAGGVPSVRLISDVAHRVSVVGFGSNITLNVGGDVVASGGGTFSGTLSASNLVLTGTVASSAVLAGPSAASGSASFRRLTAIDVSGVEQITNKGQPNGYAGLDANGQVPTIQLPAAVQGGLNYQGTWNAAMNVPTLVSGSGAKGAYYTVAAAGTITIDGISQWSVGDHIAFNGTRWEKLQGVASAVLSVAGRTGIVVIAATDVAGLATVARSGNYFDLTNLPAMPAVGTVGLVKSDGTSFGSASVGAGLIYASGTLATSGLVSTSSPVLTGNMRRLTASNLTAAGASQAGATSLSGDFNEVVTVANGANGVQLPDPGTGAEIIVCNGQGTVALLVYPPSGQSIDVSAVNVPTSIGGNATKTFRKMTPSKWYSQ